MSEFNIEVEGGSSVRLPTGGKYCPKDIIVTAKGGSSAGGGDLDALIEGTITEVNSGVTSVVGFAFYGQKKLTSANLQNATIVCERAFYLCTNLTRANFPKATQIGQYAFYSCSKLTSIDLPSATSIGNSAFHSCSKLTSIDLPSATSIEANSFNGCSALTSIDLPSATSIGNSAFEYCNKIVSANLPSATSIGSSAFSRCASLKSVILRSETVCALANTSAFQYCYHILGTVNSTYNPNGDRDGYIYVPANLVDAYKSATNWSTYASQIRAIEDSESNKLPTPDIMVEGDSLYVNNISNAASVSVYCTTSEDAREADWVFLNTFSCYEDVDEINHIGDQAYIDWGTLDVWLSDAGGFHERPLFFSVIAHAPNKEDSDRSNASAMEY